MLEDASQHCQKTAAPEDCGTARRLRRWTQVLPGLEIRSFLFADCAKPSKYF